MIPLSTHLFCSKPELSTTVWIGPRHVGSIVKVTLTTGETVRFQVSNCSPDPANPYHDDYKTYYKYVIIKEGLPDRITQVLHSLFDQLMVQVNALDLSTDLLDSFAFETTQFIYVGMETDLALVEGHNLPVAIKNDRPGAHDLGIIRILEVE